MYSISKFNYDEFETEEDIEKYKKIDDDIEKLNDNIKEFNDEIKELQDKINKIEHKKHKIKCIIKYDKAEEKEAIREDIKNRFYATIPNILNFNTEDEAYDYFCKMQNYSGRRILNPPVKDNNGNEITDWRRIATECVYAPTSKVYAVKNGNKYNAIKPFLKKGDIVVNTSEAKYGYRTNGVRVYDGEKIAKLRYDGTDYGNVPLWALDVPLTYFSVPSIHVYGSYGVIIAGGDPPVARTKKDCKIWIDAINQMIKEKADYCVVNNKYVVIKNKGILYDNNINPLYLEQNSIFEKINREKIPKHSIVHKSFLDLTEQEIAINKKTGIPFHHMFYA